MAQKLLLRTQALTNLQQVVSSRLLQVSTVELAALVTQELADNPALELEGELPHFPSVPHGPVADDLADETWEVAHLPKVLDDLLAQAALLASERDRDLVTHLIHSLDDRGYLDPSWESEAAQVGASDSELERALGVLHTLDPPGVGARSLQECLILQCMHLEVEGAGAPLVRCILAQAWEDFVAGRWSRVARALSVPVGAVEDAAGFISRNLYPHPLALVPGQAAASDQVSRSLSPDIIISQDRDHLRVEIPWASELTLRVSPSFRQALATTGGHVSPAERDWIGQEICRARLFISALGQRWSNLRRLGEFLVEHQGDYLRHGLRYLHPMTQADAADQLDLHPSTVSRLVRDKVIQLPNGRLAPMTECFDGAVAVREAIRQLLLEASHPLSDRDIAERLESQNLFLARRTVAKYRMQLRLPAGRGVAFVAQRRVPSTSHAGTSV